MDHSFVRWYWTAAAIPIVAGLSYAVFLVIRYKRLPANVPVHYGFDGSPNSYMFRGLWAILSPLLLFGLALLVLTTRPGVPFTALLCWIALGLVYGSFFEIVRSSSSGSRFHPVALSLGAVAMPLMEAVVSLLLRPWWSR